MKIELKIVNKKFYKVYRSLGTSYFDLPKYQSAGSAAMDLICTEDVAIYPGEIKMIPTGLAIWIGSNQRLAGWLDEEVAGLILPRSGLGTKGLVLANTIGVIDEDYQGELMVSAWNRRRKDLSATFLSKANSWADINSDEHPDNIELKAGDRFAQLMFIPIIKAQWEVVDEFSEKTKRQSSGFGSTGK